jgi:4'-phosphopantetheinyl transferase
MTTRQTLIDLEANCIHIWHIDLDGSTDDLVALLSSDEIRIAKAKVKKIEQDRYIRARGCMRSILSSYLNIAGSELKFNVGDKGKPSIRDNKSNIEFNLTHCEGIALLAVTRTNTVGIDLERIRNKPSLIKIAQRTFTDGVYAELKQIPPEKIAARFFHYWTELEARAKCKGCGIFSKQEELDEITSHHFSPKQDWLACIAISKTDITSIQLKHFVYSY